MTESSAHDRHTRPRAAGGAASRRETAHLLRDAPWKDEHGHLRAIIESPQGSHHKLKFDAAAGAFRVAASLPAGMTFPFDFGFVPETKADDGDPLDVLVLMDAPTYPGVAVAIRLLGVIEALQSDKGDGNEYRNDRLIAIARDSTERGSPKRLRDLDPHLIDEIRGFFGNYAHLEGKEFKVLRCRGRRAAREMVEASHRRRSH